MTHLKRALPPAFVLFFAAALVLWAAVPTVRWKHISSATGEIPVPDEAPEPTASLILDVDKSGREDFLVGSRNHGPAVVWYRRGPAGWTQYVIESELLRIEAGSAFYDIDGDGDLDIVFAADAGSNEIWWWENPYPNYDPKVNWKRRVIKSSGGNKHHDQIFGDFDGDGKTDFVSWNQRARTLLLFKIPDDPRNHQGEWPHTVIYSWDEGDEHEGLAAVDINGDGRLNIVGGGRWFEHTGGGKFRAHVIDDGYRFSRVVAGRFIKGSKWAQVVFGPGDNIMRLRFFERAGDSWKSRDLLGEDVIHGHTLQAADINGDGNLDIFCGEMGQWGPKAKPPNNPNARIWVFYGDGKGNFTKQLVHQGQGIHEGRVGDLTGDGRLDILGKPFRHNAPRLDVWLNQGSGPMALNKWERHVIDEKRPWRAIFITYGDIDGDGHKDIITGGWWYRNPGRPGGVWTRHAIGEGLKNMAVVADFNHDGLLDMLGTGGEGSQANAKFVWARNLGGGKFVIHDNIPEADGDFLQGATVARFADDRSLGVALSWHRANHGIQMFTVPRDPVKTLWRWEKVHDFSQDEEISAGDIDRDGRMDLLLGTRWLRNEGGGKWNLHTIHPTEGDPDRNRLVDMNGNGRLDAVVGFEAINQPGKLAWYEQTEAATNQWTEHVIGWPIGPMSLDVADMNGNGWPDVVVGEHNYKEPEKARLLIYENLDGKGTRWKEHVVHTGDEHHDGAIVVDIDGDGDLDIISIGWSHPRVLLYENKAR